MTIDPIVIVVLLVIFLAALARSTFGFADALIAMPLLTIVAGLEVARPLVALTAATISAAILLRNWGHVHLASAWRLVLASWLGIPIGFYFMRTVPDGLVKALLAVFIIAFSLYNLARPRLLELKSDLPSFLFGFVAGVLGGAYNTSGPPVAIYGTLRRWTAAQFRATFQSFALPTALAVSFGHALSGRFTAHVLLVYVACLPVLALALPLGAFLNHRLHGARFATVIHILLILIAALLLVVSVTNAWAGRT